VRHRKGVHDTRAFGRFPAWMWRNREFDGFLTWLAGHNRGRPPGAQTGIYGLDLYSLAGSMRAVVDYLERTDPEAAKVARERYGCLTPWAQEPAAYGRMAVSGRYAACEGAVTAMLGDLLQRQVREAPLDEEALFDATQNARLVRDAEAYYRAMYYGGGEAWNRRDTHMFETLQAILEAKGPAAKAVVWAHNSHIGDARATEMGVTRDELNLGQLTREAYGQTARLIGFGTHSGTVACASDWTGRWKSRWCAPRSRRARSGARTTPARAAATCWTCGPTTTAPCAARSPTRGWSGSSASSTGPRPSAGATTPRPACPNSSTPGCGSTRPPR
jgi:erythromycin esterase-like protein